MSESNAVRELREATDDSVRPRPWGLIKEKAEAVIAELEAAKRDYDRELGARRATQQLACHLENERNGARRERDALESQLHEQFKGVVLIRCIKHINVPQQNHSEHSGGECGGCIAEQLGAVTKERDEARAACARKDRELQLVLDWCNADNPNFEIDADAVSAALKEKGTK